MSIVEISYVSWIISDLDILVCMYAFSTAWIERLLNLAETRRGSLNALRRCGWLI
jgi:hypothetical protein